MSAFSDYLENLLNEVLYRNTTYSRPANVYISAHTGNPTETGGNEVSGGSYARQAVPTGAGTGWTASVGGVTDNVNAITFPVATVAWGDIVGVGIWDAVTAGNLLEAFWLSNEAWLFTGLNAGDVFTAPGNTLANNDRVILQTLFESALPTGVSANTIYWVVNETGDTFQLSLTQGGAAIALTTDGAGVVHKLQVKTIGVNDQLTFPAGNLDLQKI